MKTQTKTVLAAVALLVSTHNVAAASAPEDVIATFQWVGTVPASVPGANWKIINTGVIDHLAGTVTFGGTSGAYEITDSSELRFSVVDGANSDAGATSFDYNLTSLRFSAGGGFMTDANGEFVITGDGSDLTLGNTVSKSGSEVSLKVKTNAATAVINEGDEVVIQAVILVNNQV